jgi:hypothetical protein
MNRIQRRKRAKIARQHGMHHARTIMDEANRAGIRPSLACAMVEQETGDCENVFGHDPTIFVGRGHVTPTLYRAYKTARRMSGNRLMQGVGPLQLTWWQTQDRADAMGGCDVVRYNLRCGFQTLAALIKEHGEQLGIERYNGSGPRARAYRASVLAKNKKWHERFN